MSKIVFQGKTEDGLDILVRYPTRVDLKPMHKFINDLSAERTFVRNQGIKISLEEEKEFLEKQLKGIGDKTKIQLLAFNNTNLVGISGIEMKDRAQKHVGNLGISVAKDFRTRGVGSKLMEIVIKEAKKNLLDLKLFVLTVFANNTVAYEMYKKFGFREFGRLPKGVIHRDKFVDEVYMYKEI